MRENFAIIIRKLKLADAQMGEIGESKMEIRQIYYVLEIAKQKSFSGAAKTLFITQPAISQQISALENELQTKLFLRDTHKVTLTKEGERFCEYGKKVLEAVDNLTEAFGQGRSDQKTFLNVGVFPFYRVSGLAQAIANFFSTNTNVLGSLKVMENYKAFDLLSEGKIDFAIIKAIPDDVPSGLIYDILAEENLCAVINRENDCEEEEFIQIKKLGDLPLLTGEKGSSLYDYMKNIYEKNHIRFNVVFFNTKAIDLMLEMIASGTGILLATESVAREIAKGPAKAYRIEPKEKLWTMLVYKKDRRLKGAEIAFRNHILQYYQNDFQGAEEMIVETVE